MSTSKSKQNFTAWAIVAIIGLLGLNAYQWFVNSQLKTQNNIQQTNMVELQSIQKELEQSYDSALANLEELRGDNKELNDLIESQKSELKEQKEKISNLIWTKRELTRAKEEIANLTTQANQYLAELNKLKEENATLVANNMQLKSSNDALTTEVASVNAKNTELSEARAILASEKQTLSTKNEKLSAKVDMANAIKINFMEVTGFEVKESGKLKKKSRAKNINLLRTCFTTETNLVTASGEKKFYLRFINPQGETVESSGGGVVENKLDNSEVRYTTSGTIDYKNEDTNACIDWQFSEQLAKGVYDIEMYNNGFLVGKGNFKLK